jgi:hypothetical protein
VRQHQKPRVPKGISFGHKAAKTQSRRAKEQQKLFKASLSSSFLCARLLLVLDCGL